MELLLAAGLVVGVWWLLTRPRRDAHGADAWDRGPVPAGGRVAVPRGGPRRVLRSLTAVEARHHLRSLPFAFGVVLTAACVLAMTGWVDIFDNGAVVGRYFLHLGGLAYPITGMVVLATNRAARRDRRERATELMETMPTAPATRSGAWMGAAWPSLLVLGTGIVTVITLATTGHTESGAIGPWGPDWLAETLLAFALVAGGAALGVALARWIPFGLAAPAALVALLFVTMGLNMITPRTDRLRNLAPWTAPPRHLPPEFMTRPAWAHLLYALGLVALSVGVALVATRRSRAVIALLTTAALVTAAGVLLQLRPPSDGRVAEIAALVDRGGRSCVVDDGIRACVYPGYEDRQETWIAGARRVFAGSPVTPATYEAVQRVGDAGVESLDPEVRTLVGPGGGGYGFGDSTRSNELDATAEPRYVLPALAAVGLPRRVAANGLGCYAGGQARAVIALALLFQASDVSVSAWLGNLATPSDGIGDTWPAQAAPWAIAYWIPDWDIDADVPVIHARTDARLAVALAAHAGATRTLRADWRRWTDPAATSSELAEALDLTDPTGPDTTRVPPGLTACA